jgi:hypothetical protein
LVLSLPGLPEPSPVVWDLRFDQEAAMRHLVKSHHVVGLADCGGATTFVVEADLSGEAAW